MEPVNVVELMHKEERYPPAHMCAETIRVLHCLEEFEQGQEMTYAELERRCGFSIRAGTTGYSRYHTAKQAILREKGFDFAPISGVGIRRLKDGEIVDRCDRKLPAVRRTIKREQTKLSSVQSEKLSAEQASQRNTLATIYAFMRKGSSAQITRRIEQKTREEKAQLSLDAIIGLFEKKD